MNRFVFAVLLLGLAACSSWERRPATDLAAPTIFRQDKFVLRELSSYIMNDNYPAPFFSMKLQKGEHYELEIQRDASEPRAPANANALDAMISCDAPFSLREGHSLKDHPGPSQVHFQLFRPDSGKAVVRFSPSADVSECRLFLKDPAQPTLVYGVRLVAREAN